LAAPLDERHELHTPSALVQGLAQHRELGVLHARLCIADVQALADVALAACDAQMCEGAKVHQQVCQPTCKRVASEAVRGARRLLTQDQPAGLHFIWLQATHFVGHPAHHLCSKPRLGLTRATRLQSAEHLGQARVHHVLDARLECTILLLLPKLAAQHDQLERVTDRHPLLAGSDQATHTSSQATELLRLRRGLAAHHLSISLAEPFGICYRLRP